MKKDFYSFAVSTARVVSALAIAFISTLVMVMGSVWITGNTMPSIKIMGGLLIVIGFALMGWNFIKSMEIRL